MQQAPHLIVDGAPMPGPAPRFSATPGEAGAVPDVDADTLAILAGLGYDEDALAALREAGAIV